MNDRAQCCARRPPQLAIRLQRPSPFGPSTTSYSQMMLCPIAAVFWSGADENAHSWDTTAQCFATSTCVQMLTARDGRGDKRTFELC